MHKRVEERSNPDTIYLVDVHEVPDDHGARVVICLQKERLLVLCINQKGVAKLVVLGQVEGIDDAVEHRVAKIIPGTKHNALLVYDARKRDEAPYTESGQKPVMYERHPENAIPFTRTVVREDSYCQTR